MDLRSLRTLGTLKSLKKSRPAPPDHMQPPCPTLKAAKTAAVTLQRQASACRETLTTLINLHVIPPTALGRTRCRPRGGSGTDA